MTHSPYGDDPRRNLVAPHPAYTTAYPPMSRPTSGMAVASLVLGVVGVLAGWCSFAIPCILAVVFGYVGLGQTRGGLRRGRGMAIAGLVLGIVPVAILALVLVFGGIGALLAPASDVLSKSADKTPAATPQGKGPVVPLTDALIINLADGHYLKLDMTFQLAAGQPAQLDTSQAQQIAIDVYTSRKMSELGTEQGRDAAKQQVKDQITQAYAGAVLDVYYTTFVTQ